jgi:thioesterase domain-containing protein
VHPSGGDALCYADLGRLLGRQQTIYGLQDTSLSGGPRHTDLRSMASDYLAALLRVQPEGPYQLGGWSMGGVVAFQMACELRERGHDVRLLALLDSVAPRYATSPPESMVLEAFVRRLAHFSGRPGAELWPDRLAALEGDRKLDYVLALFQELGLMPADAGRDDIVARLELTNLHTELARDFRPCVYPGIITLFRCSSDPSGDVEDGAGDAGGDPTRGWGELARGGVRTRDVPGDHLTMMAQPHVEALAAHLLACLEDVEATPAVCDATAVGIS